MARINKKNIISGKIGNLVFRNLDGKQVVQAKPEKVNQTKFTKLSSSEFTQSSRSCCTTSFKNYPDASGSK